MRRITTTKGRARGMSREQSVQPHGLMRTVERESGNIYPETFTILFLHFIAALHDAARGRKGAAAGIGKMAARLQHRLLADHARSLDFLRHAFCIGNPPVAIEQLHSSEERRVGQW